MMKIHVLRTGEVRVSPYLPFGGDHCSYATKSWKEMITSGISLDKKMQRRSLEWIREQSLDPNCVESLATHDTEIVPHTIDL